MHALSDGRGRLLVVLLTAGNVHDRPMFARLFAALRVGRAGAGRPRTQPDCVVADKGYSSKGNRGLLRARGIGHTTPEKADQAAIRHREGSAGGYRASAETATPAAAAANAASASSNSRET